MIILPIYNLIHHQFLVAVHSAHVVQNAPHDNLNTFTLKMAHDDYYLLDLHGLYTFLLLLNCLQCMCKCKSNQPHLLSAAYKLTSGPLHV